MPEPLRFAVRCAVQLLLLPLLAGCWVERAVFGAERWFVMCAELLSLGPGWPGSVVRTAFYAATLRHCATRAYISFGTVIVRRDASVGRDVYIGPYSIIGRAEIGDGVKIASRVSVMSGRYQHAATDALGAASIPFYQSVAIGAQSWIGEGAIVMADIGRAAIVGAGSVVVRPVLDGSAVAGNPARELRSERTPRPVAAAPVAV